MLIGSYGLCMFFASGVNALMGFGPEFTPRDPNSFARLEHRELLNNVIIGIENPSYSGRGRIIVEKSISIKSQPQVMLLLLLRKEMCIINIQ